MEPRSTPEPIAPETTPMRAAKVPLKFVRTNLAKVWFAGAGFNFAILFLMTLMNRFGDTVRDVYAWFLPTLVPTLSLIITVLGAAALEGDDRRNVDVFFYQLAWWLSLTYVGCLAATILLQPFSSLRPIDLYSVANFGLGPLQGLVVASIGYIFVSKQDEK